MKFSHMNYERPDAELLKEHLKSLTERMAAAASYEEAREVFLEMEKLTSEVMTVMQIASIRHTIDTRDEFYDAEQKWWDNTMPEMQVYLQSYKMALLGSPFREDFAKEYGELMFVNAEMQLKTFSSEIVPLLQQENMEANAYEKLLASAQIPFEGKIYTLSQLTPFKTDADDARRLEAWKAEGQWYMDNAEALDEHYDKLTKLRDEMGRKLGYGGFTTLGYYRMTRNCYDKNDVERFRKAVREYIVPIADRSYREQAERLGVEYPLSYADAALSFRSGNPRPVGTPDEIVQQALDFYEDLSPETGEFFKTMIDNELLDLLSTEGKASGGYCTSLPEYKCPFIFANFNGTQGDIEVVTHEAGHAFQGWMNRNRVPLEYQWATLEACEVHSMSME
ncbi:MAG: M3 family oligoendopeptidase, partial [Clostridiales bacterium]|nr:M3 family oligoendopeptidase [Clostridiales bacterium]